MPRGSRIETVSGRALFLGATTPAGVAVVVASPAGNSSFLGSVSTKLQNLADLFAYYRFTKLAFRVIGVNTTCTSVGGYENAVTNTAPTSRTEIMDLPHVGPSTTWYTALVYPSVVPFSSVPKGLLGSGMTKWYKVGNSSVDDALERQGLFYFFGPGSGQCDIEFIYTCQFRDFTGPAQIPSKPKVILRDTTASGSYGREQSQSSDDDSFKDLSVGCPPVSIREQNSSGSCYSSLIDAIPPPATLTRKEATKGGRGVGAGSKSNS